MSRNDTKRWGRRKHFRVNKSWICTCNESSRNCNGQVGGVGSQGKGRQNNHKNKSSKIGRKGRKNLKGNKPKWKTKQKVNIFCWSPPLNSLGKRDNLKPAERKTSEGIVSDNFPGSLTMSSLGGLSWNRWVYVISLNWNCSWEWQIENKTATLKQISCSKGWQKTWNLRSAHLYSTWSSAGTKIQVLMMQTFCTMTRKIWLHGINRD